MAEYRRSMADSTHGLASRKKGFDDLDRMRILGKVPERAVSAWIENRAVVAWVYR
jgi:hypothetical protein